MKSDEVTRIIQDDVNETVYESIRGWTVADLREWILDETTTGSDIRKLSRGLTAEMIAAVCKLMGNLDLIYAASKITVTAHCNTTIGLPGTLSCRLQPNHTTDDPEGITASTAGGTELRRGGCGHRPEPGDGLPGAGRQGAAAFSGDQGALADTDADLRAGPRDGTDQGRQGGRALRPDLPVHRGQPEGQRGLRLLRRDAGGSPAAASEAGHRRGAERDVLRDGAGLGAQSSNAHFDTDQVTMEARCYGFAKRFSPFLVNTVVGFIGPEYLYDARQVTRAGLEDHFMGKLTGISMGCDCCYTNHMKADQNDIENLASLLTMAGCNYFMGIPHGDDIMLNYQTTGFRETAALREITGKTAIPEFQRWLEKMGFVENGRLTKKAGDGSSLLF